MLQGVIGRVLAAAGVLIVLASVLADVIGQLPFAAGLGVGRDPGFGGQQVTGAILGVAVLAVGIWLWRKPGAGKSVAARYLLAALAAAVVVAGPIYMATQSGRQPWAQVESCVQAKPVPGSASGQRRVTHEVRITNPGKKAVYVDSMFLEAFRDTDVSWLTLANPVDMTDVVQWKLIQTVTITARGSGAFELPPGGQARVFRTYVLPADEEPSPPYKFRAYVFLKYRTWRPVESWLADWIENFPEEC